MLPPRGATVTRYFLHLRDGADDLLDEEGSEFADLSALRGAVLFNAREMMTVGVRDGVLDLRFRIDAETAAGDIVHSLRFSEAVNILPPAP